MNVTYRAYGLVVDSDVALALPAADGRGPADLVLRRGPDRPVPAGDPDGELLARVAGHDGTVFYTIATDGAHTRVRYPGLCEFVGDVAVRDVRVALAPGGDPGVIPVLAGGLLLALHLRLRGDLVLHASAVRVGEGAVAFVGASGMGKSTIATVLCAAGHPLLTDDVLRAELRPDAVVAYPGSTETRLRDAARPLAATLPGTARPTVDGRLAVAPAAHAGTPVPLAACVVPRPSREHDRVQARRLRGPHALMLLSQFPRILGWAQPSTLAREFEQLADLVARVPVVEARIPWGPPFAPDLSADLLAAISDAQR